MPSDRTAEHVVCTAWGVRTQLNGRKHIILISSYHSTNNQSKTVLADVIGASALPTEYGGAEGGTTFGDSPVEQSLRRLVMSVCCDNKVEPGKRVAVVEVVKVKVL